MIFNDSQVRMAFCREDAQRDKIESVREHCPDLGDVYVIDRGAIENAAGVWAAASAMPSSMSVNGAVGGD